MEAGFDAVNAQGRKGKVFSFSEASIPCPNTSWLTTREVQYQPHVASSVETVEAESFLDVERSASLSLDTSVFAVASLGLSGSGSSRSTFGQRRYVCADVHFFYDLLQPLPVPSLRLDPTFVEHIEALPEAYDADCYAEVRAHAQRKRVDSLAPARL